MYLQKVIKGECPTIIWPNYSLGIPLNDLDYHKKGILGLVTMRILDAANSESQQGYTPFSGMELTGRVKSTFLRGDLIYDRGEIVGNAKGRYLRVIG